MNWHAFVTPTDLITVSCRLLATRTLGPLTLIQIITQDYLAILAGAYSRFSNVDWVQIIRKSPRLWVFTDNQGRHLECGETIFQTHWSGGGDIDKASLFQEERISTGYINQLDAGSIREFWQAIAVTNFDFMLDDGLHTFDAGSNLFTHSIEHLASSGIYVIEDVSLPDISKYKEFFQDTDFLVDYVLLYRPKLGPGDNNLVVVRKSSST